MGGPGGTNRIVDARGESCDVRANAWDRDWGRGTSSSMNVGLSQEESDEEIEEVEGRKAEVA